MNTYIEIAYILSTKSKCKFKKSGAVIVKDNKILSTGISGTLPGYINCEDVFFGENSEKHDKFSELWEISAEENCLIHSVGTDISGAYIYCTHKPKWKDMKLLIASGIYGIFYCVGEEKESADEIECLKAYRDITIEKIM